jgi:hypothetical protein
MGFGADCRVANHLCHAGVVAHIQKDDVPQVASAAYPAGQKNGLSRMRLSQLPAVVRSLPITKKVQFQVHRRKEIVNYK